MELWFEPVTEENRQETERLEPFLDQAGFLEPVRDCLEEARAEKAWRPVRILSREGLVGFAMYGRLREPSGEERVWMDRLLIGRDFQGKGYGRAAVSALLEKLFQEYGCGEIYLSVYAENKRAMGLYRKLGFLENGELDAKGERVMVKKK